MTNKQKTLILITNDDGVNAKGIKALTEVMRTFGDVVVVAPETAMSGMSHAITVKKNLYITQEHKEEGLEIFRVNGTPSDCVKLAMNVLLDRTPDFLVSGINHGSNSSVNVHYSGTMGGAREGALYGIPSIGFSLLDHDHDADFTVSVEVCREVFDYVFKNGMEQGVYYNVNIPKATEIKGLKICRQTKGHWIEEFFKLTDESGNGCYKLTGEFLNEEPEATDTDDWALMNGYASLVPCLVDVTSFESLNKLQDLCEV